MSANPSHAPARPEGPAGSWAHDRTHLKRMIQRTGREPTPEWMARVVRTLALVLLFPRNRGGTPFPQRIVLTLDPAGAFRVVLQDQGFGRPDEAYEELLARGTWTEEGGDVRLDAAEVYDLAVVPSEATRVAMALRDGALWVDLGVLDGVAWALRWQRTHPEPPPRVSEGLP